MSDHDTIRVTAPEPPPELMAEIEAIALTRYRSGEYTIGAAARSACDGLEAPEHVAMDLAERIRSGQ